MVDKVEWDYSALAAHYDKRADYAPDAIRRLLDLAAPGPGLPVADIGAGTGKLTKELLAAGFAVHAVEPNDAMRAHGIRNTAGQRVVWSVGTGENTGLASHAYDLVTFGSSFNVMDRARALAEVKRMARPRGWFACMWNHRDLSDPLQQACEAVIRQHIPNYDYGTRREDQTEAIRASGLFDPPVYVEGRTVAVLPAADFMDAWRSHGTLQRQAGDRFGAVLRDMERVVAAYPTPQVPYTTRIWLAQLKS